MEYEESGLRLYQQQSLRKMPGCAPNDADRNDFQSSDEAYANDDVHCWVMAHCSQAMSHASSAAPLEDQLLQILGNLQVRCTCERVSKLL